MLLEVVRRYKHDAKSSKKATDTSTSRIPRQMANAEHTGTNGATSISISGKLMVSRERQGGNKHAGTEALKGQGDPGTTRRGIRVSSWRSKGFQNKAIKVRRRGKLTIWWGGGVTWSGGSSGQKISGKEIIGLKDR